MIQLQKLLKSLIQPIIAVIFGLAIGGIIISLTGGSVFQTYTELWNGAFGNFISSPLRWLALRLFC